MQDSPVSGYLQPPSLLASRYELGAELGRGGMGVVYRCLDRQTREARAVKFLTASRVRDEAEVRRFQHEAKLLTRFTHPNIIRVHDFGVEGEFPYLISELCLMRHGQPGSLEALQQQAPNRRLGAAHLTALIPPIVAALADLHRAGLIHRDIKPSNILLSEAADGTLTPKLSDFGLVAVTGDQALRQLVEFSMSLSIEQESASSLSLVGTYAYMSPEQKRGELLDARSDVYSLGLMVYRLATGYERVSFMLPTEVNSDVPPWVDDLVKASVDTDRERRARTAAELCELLPEPWRGYWGQPATAPAPVVPPATPPGDAPAPAPDQPAPPRSAAIALPKVVAAVAVLAMISALVVTLALRFSSRESAPPPVPIEQLLASTSPDEVEQALVQLRDRRGEAGSDLLPALERLLRHDDARIRRLAGVFLPGLAMDDPRLQALLIGALADGDPDLQAAVLQAARQWEPAPAGAVPEVNRVFAKATDPVKQLAAEMLDRLDVPPAPEYLHYHLYRGHMEAIEAVGEEAVAFLRAALISPDLALRQQAIEAFARLASRQESVLHYLAGLLWDNDEVVRASAASALSSVGKPALPVLMPLLLQSSMATRPRLLALLDAWQPEPVAANAPYFLCKGMTDTLVSLGMPGLQPLLPQLTTVSDADRRVLLEVIARLGPAAAETVPVLRQLLAGGPNLGSDTVIEALLAIGPEAAAATPELAAIAILPNDRRAQSAAAALVTLRPQPEPYLLPFYLQLAREAATPKRHAYALTGLARVGGGSPAAMELLQAGLLSKHPEVADTAAEGLVAQGRRALPSLLPLLTGDAQEPQMRAIRVLSAMGEQALPAMDDLIATLGSDREPVAGAAAEALAGLGTPAIDPLIEALRNERQRPRATIALARIGPAALIKLRNALLSDDWATRSGVLAALASLGPQAKPALPDLVKALSQPNRYHPEEVLRALRQIGEPDPEALALTWRLVDSSLPQVRDGALAALAGMSPDGARYLGQTLSHPDPAVRRETLRLLKSVDEPAARVVVPYLVEYYRSTTDHDLRVEVLKLLGGMGPAAAPALNLLRQALRSDVLGERVIAAAALGALGATAAPALDDLRELRKGEKSEWFRIAARQAIEQIERATR